MKKSGLQENNVTAIPTAIRAAAVAVVVSVAVHHALDARRQLLLEAAAPRGLRPV